MKPPRYERRVFMKFEVSPKREVPSVWKSGCDETRRSKKALTKRQIVELFFDHCDGCLKMAAIPHGAFAARKVRERAERRFLISNMEKKGGSDKDSKQDNGYSKKNAKEEGRELTPLKYNSKLMNSIWGLYNRYSVHNFKKNTDADDLAVAAACWGPANIRNRPPTSSTVEYTAAARFQQYLTTGSAKL